VAQQTQSLPVADLAPAVVHGEDAQLVALSSIGRPAQTAVAGEAGPQQYFLRGEGVSERTRLDARAQLALDRRQQFPSVRRGRLRIGRLRTGGWLTLELETAQVVERAERSRAGGLRREHF